MGFQNLSLNLVRLLLWCAASGHHLGAPDEEARINAQGPTNQAEHHDCANPNAAAGYSDAASILNSRALRQLIEAHDLPHYIDLWRFTTFVTVLPTLGADSGTKWNRLSGLHTCPYSKYLI
jgi:hypothetical protein